MKPGGKPKPEKKEVVQAKEKPKKQKKKKNVEEKGIVFKVQIATSSKKLELKPENFNGAEGVSIYEAGGLYRYTVGKEKTMGEANILQVQLRAKGYKDAFVVAFSDGKRIAISDAIQLQQQ